MKKVVGVGVTILAVGLVLALFTAYAPLGWDWEYTFSKLPQHWRDPYQIDTFISIPYVIALVPHAFLPIRLGNAINLLLNFTAVILVVRSRKGDWRDLFLVFTSPVFLSLCLTNNVDWIPMLATLLPTSIALPILSVKPQAIGAMALIWWKRKGFSLATLLPAAVVVLLSLLVWWGWPFRVHGWVQSAWNLAPWPWMLPLGIFILVKAWQSDDDALAGAATPFLVPYCAAYSFTSVLAILSGRHRKMLAVAWMVMWWYCIMVVRRDIASGFPL